MMTWVETTGVLKVEEEKSDGQNVGAAVTRGYQEEAVVVVVVAVEGEEMNCPVNRVVVGNRNWNQKPFGRMTSCPTEGKVKEREKPGPLPHVRILQLAKPATVNKLYKHISLCMF